MKFSVENGKVTLTAEELSDFAFKKSNMELDNTSGFSPFNGYFDSNADITEYPEGKYNICEDVIIKAQADTLILDADLLTVKTVVPVKRTPYRFITAYNVKLLAKAVCTAFVFCNQYKKSLCRIVIEFISRETGETTSFFADYSFAFIEKLTFALYERAQIFIKLFVERKSKRIDEIKKLPFPYKGIRSGQQDIMLSVLKTVRKGGRLIVSAPTGTGKTMATLFPSIKALGEAYADKIFYLTGKTVTGKAAFDAVKLLNESAPSLRCIMVHSKHRSCTHENRSDGCYVCSKKSDFEYNGVMMSAEQRRHAALCELLLGHKLYSGKLISETAEKYNLCAYELSLDISEYCDVVICDYSYVFDKKMRFRRYFSNPNEEKYVFLTDECHNLPDRVRSAYSAQFGPTDTAELETLVKSNYISDTELTSALSYCRKEFDVLFADCKENATFVTDKSGEHIVGFDKKNSVPESFIKCVENLGKLCRARRDGEDHEVFEKCAESALNFVHSAVQATEGFAFLSNIFDDSLSCQLICIDPSHIIRECTESAHATVMFSATLNPYEYFADMLGCSDAPIIKGESPFDRDNLCVTVFDGISTRYSDRKNTAGEIVEVINTVLDSHEGHYFVFFPSYAYMRMVAKELLRKYPHITAVMQKENMTYGEREKFLKLFKSTKHKSIVGLCVLGGVFSEGVDLIGESLVGVVIVGAGLAGISCELNLATEYFDKKYGSGKLYAYDYPAINRIEQAAGRVIRSATDRGVVVIADHRMSSPEIARRFPETWPRVVSTADTETLSIILERFWNSEN